VRQMRWSHPLLYIGIRSFPCRLLSSCGSLQNGEPSYELPIIIPQIAKEHMPAARPCIGQWLAAEGRHGCFANCGVTQCVQMFFSAATIWG